MERFTIKTGSDDEWREHFSTIRFAPAASTRSGSFGPIASGAKSWPSKKARGSKICSEPILALRYGQSRAQIEALVSIWTEVKPLPYLKACRRPGAKQLFANLRSAGKTIGVLSDYPAQEKLAKLEFDADIVVSARDPEVDVQKPHPRGILRVMEVAGVSPGATVMIGDRAERDGEMGRRAGVRTYLLSKDPLPGWLCFRSFHEFLDRNANSTVG